MNKMYIGKPKAEDEGEDSEGEEEAGPSLSGMASRKAARRVLEAIESGDASALSSALQAHYESCAEGE
jgi:DNA-binding GntR family transcriptional regulator